MSFLENADLPVDQCYFVLFQISIHKLFNFTMKRFELRECSTIISSFIKLQNFLLNQCTLRESPFQENYLKINQLHFFLLNPTKLLPNLDVIIVYHLIASTRAIHFSQKPLLKD